ncbi:hypothetical protein AALO_G00259780 [Alosa alosa]|uniref:Beta/gamma crystallin 'Greek key' domain-containing protein n=1 Tax=Alosa alosa TaxID=278164 RepID=A0AAV6FUQ6_9TELE|nr:hypothetical protein AALO_G00259780 [Alosa alosa]
MASDEQGEEAQANLIVSDPGEASGTTQVRAEPTKLTQGRTNPLSTHTYQSQVQDSLAVPTPTEKTVESFSLQLEESFSDQANITPPAWMTVNTWGNITDRPTGPVHEDDREPSLPHTGPLQAEVPEYKMVSSECKPAALPCKAVLPLTRCEIVEANSTNMGEWMTGATLAQPESSGLSSSKSLSSATLTETRACTGSPSDQIGHTEFGVGIVTSNNGQSLTKPGPSAKLVSDVTVLNADISIPKTDITDVAANSTSNSAEVPTDMIFLNNDTTMLECEIIETTADNTAPDPDVINNANSTDISIPDADITLTSADIIVTTSDTTELLSADVTVPNPTMSCPSTEITPATTDINIPNISTVSQSLIKPCTSDGDKLVTDVAILNTDIVIPKADCYGEIAINNSTSTAELAADVISPSADTLIPELEITEPTACITAPNPDKNGYAISTDISIKANITDTTASSISYSAEIAADMISPNNDTLAECETTETTADITTLDADIVNNVISSDISIPDADITVTTSDTIEELFSANITYSPSTEITPATTDINIPNISIVEPIVLNADSTSDDNDNSFVAANITSPESEIPVVLSDIPFPSDTDISSTDVTYTEADTSDSTADTDLTSSVNHSDITHPNDDTMPLPEEPLKLSSANVISAPTSYVSGNDFETETCPSKLPQHNLCVLDPSNPECPGSEPEPAGLTCIPQVTDSTLSESDWPCPDLTSTTVSSALECSDNSNNNRSSLESFSHYNVPEVENSSYDSSNLLWNKESDPPLSQCPSPDTKTIQTRELVSPDMYSLSDPSMNYPHANMPSRSTLANINPLFSHTVASESHSISTVEVQVVMVKEQESTMGIEKHMDYEAEGTETRAGAPTDPRNMPVEVGRNEAKDGESDDKTCMTSLDSLATEERVENNESFDKSSGVDEHLATPALEDVTGFVGIKGQQSTKAPSHAKTFFEESMEAPTDICNVDKTQVGIEDAVTGQKTVLVDVAIADAAQYSKTELASLTDLKATECHVPSPQRNSFAGEKISYAANPLMSDKAEGVDGHQDVVITNIPQCFNIELDTVCSEHAEVDAPRVVPQSFDEKQNRQTEDAFSGVMDKRIEVRPRETTMVSQVEVSESIVPVQVHQRGIDPKEIPEEMCNNNCSMDGESHIQQEVLLQTIGEMKQEEVEGGRPVHSSLVLPWEPATPVTQVCEAMECDPTPPSQEPGKERVGGASLNSCCLAAFPDSGTKPLPQARGKITENECSVAGAESTNNLPETHPRPTHLTGRAADADQTPPANTRLPDTEKQTHRHMEAETHTQQARTQKTPIAASADTLPATGAVGQGSLEQPTQWQGEAPSTTPRHAAITTEASSLAILRTDPGTEAAVPCMVEPGSSAFSDGLAGTTPHLTDTGLPKQHRPVIIVHGAAGPTEYQTSADTTHSSTMEVSKATFSFSSFSTPETKDLSTSQVPNTYTFSSSSIPENRDGKQCYKVSIAGIPRPQSAPYATLNQAPRLCQTTRPRTAGRRYSYQYRPNTGTGAVPLTETLDYHQQGVSSPSYSFSSPSTVTDALPLELARYTPHRFTSEEREQPEMQPTSPALPSSPGNQRSWLSDRAEVQPSELGGRSWAGPALTPAGESGAEGGRESESVLERGGDRALYSGSDVPLFTDRSSSGVGPTSPTVQPDDYSGVFKATRVEITPSSPTSSFSSSFSSSSFSTGSASSTAISTSPVSPQEPVSPHLETLMDTLKTMEKTSRVRSSRLSGAPSLPPIKEDIPDSPAKEPSTASSVPASRTSDSSMLFSSNLNGNVPVSLPANLGLNWNTTKDMRSPLTLMKLQQQQIGHNMPLRASTASSIVMRSSSFGEEDASQLHQLNQLNGNGGMMSPSRLDNSLIFSSGYQPQQHAFQSQQQAFQSMENGLQAQRSLFRTGSLPETGTMGGHERISSAQLGLGGMQSGGHVQANHNLNTSRIERLSFLASPAGSTTLDGYTDRMSMPPQQLSPLADMHIGLGQASQQVNPLDSRHHLGLQRSYSSDSPLGSTVGSSFFNDLNNGRGQQAHQQVQPEPEPPKQPPPKYRAFPDAYLTKEKEHGKLNPRPGKMIIFDQPGMRGQRLEVRGDVVDATEWEFPESISLRIIRGGGHRDSDKPFDTPDEAHKQNGQTQIENEEAKEKPEVKKFVIGSIRRAVRDYSVPEISLFPEENAEGKKVVFRDTSEDARIFGFPIKANSIIINAGLWLVYAEPFFQGIPRVLEVGGFTNPAAWGVTQPYVGSLHPLKIGEPRVEKPNEPKLVLYDKAYFTGRSRELCSSMRDFMTRVDRQQTAFMYNAGSIKVIGGCWVGYEKEGFRGKQYLLEEGEYQDWRVWGGCDAELRSVRIIRADLTDPALVMYELPDEQLEEPQEERTFEVTEAIPDVELFGFRITTRSIQVLSGAWVAYSHVDFSGNQYVLEKGFYNNCADWGADDNRICSLQPILMAPSDGPGYRNEVMLYSDTDFQGNCKLCTKNEETLPDSFIAKSCRVVGSSWVLYEGRSHTGNLYTVSEGDYPNLNSMGCPPHCIIRSIKAMFAVPSISLFGLECFEGREITVDTEVLNLLEEGFNNHVLSVKVNNGCWVVCEHSNYRGRQFLLEPIEITSWQKFSELTSVGSMYPIREKRRFFRVKNKERGHYLSIQGGGEDMKSGRVVVMEEVEGMSDVWYYHDGLIKNKMSSTTSLQVMGTVEPGAKVVLWNETRTPVQIWSISLNGTIVSTTFPGMVLDIKGGKAYDRDHVVIREEREQPCQHWELELL